MKKQLIAVSMAVLMAVSLIGCHDSEHELLSETDIVKKKNQKQKILL